MNLVTEQNVIRVKMALFGGLFIFGFFVIIAVPVTTNKLDYCPLYFDWSKGRRGPDSNCGYVIAMAVIFQLFYTIYRLVIFLLLMLGRFPQEFFLVGDLFELIYTAIDTAALFLTFIAACILSAGINATCNGNCNWLNAIDSNALSRMRTAEAGAWISFILWLLLVVLGIFWLFRQGKLPFLRRSAQASGTSEATPGGQTPNMGTPPASEQPTYDEAKY